MATIKGPLDITGSFGDIRIYYDPATGKKIVSTKGGPTKEQINNDPNCKRTKECANEFGGRSKWASLLKQSLSDIGHLMFVRCFGQIMTAGNLIQQQDEESEQGYHGVVVNKEPDVLFGIDFNERHPFRKVIRQGYETTLSPDKTTVTLNYPGFIASKDARWVAKYFAVRIYLVIAQISDMAWNAVTKRYEPVVADLELLSRCTVSEWMVRNSVPIDIQLEASFEQPAFSSPGTTLIVAMGVEFSTSAIKGQPYPIPGSGSIAIVQHFTS
jgi:hypothetical protein